MLGWQRASRRFEPWVLCLSLEVWQAREAWPVPVELAAGLPPGWYCAAALRVNGLLSLLARDEFWAYRSFESHPWESSPWTVPAGRGWDCDPENGGRFLNRGLVQFLPGRAAQLLRRFSPGGWKVRGLWPLSAGPGRNSAALDGGCFFRPRHPLFLRAQQRASHRGGKQNHRLF